MPYSQVVLRVVWLEDTYYKQKASRFGFFGIIKFFPTFDLHKFRGMARFNSQGKGNEQTQIKSKGHTQIWREQKFLNLGQMILYIHAKKICKINEIYTCYLPT